MPRDVCSDPERDWYPQREVCWPSAVLAAAAALYAERHEGAPYHDGSFERWSKTRSFDFPFQFGDGVKVSLTEQQVNTEWLTGSVAQEVAGSLDEAEDHDTPGADGQ